MRPPPPGPPLPPETGPGSAVRWWRLDAASPGAQLLSLLGALGALLVLSRFLPLEEGLAALRGWLGGLGTARGMVACAGVYALSELLLIPGSGMAMLAGALFGPWLGSAVVWAGASTSAIAGFLLARGALRRWAARLAARSPRFARLEAAIAAGGWRWVALLRLFPVVPYALQNYLLGLTPVGLRPYALASSSAMLPSVLLYCWAGHVGAVALSGPEGALAGLGRPLAALAIVGAVLLALGAFARRRLAHH